MIEKGKKVSIHYTLKVNGEVVDSSQGKEPLEYVQGEGMIIPGLESELEGMKAGDKKDVAVVPEKAYGPVNEQAVVDVPKENFSSEEGEPRPGMTVQVAASSGQMLTGNIVDVKDETLTVDFNHPLAGKELMFNVEVVDVK